jgi:hypothetical protein
MKMKNTLRSLLLSLLTVAVVSAQTTATPTPAEVTITPVMKDPSGACTSAPTALELSVASSELFSCHNKAWYMLGVRRLADPGANGIVFRSSTNTTRAATAADFAGLTSVTNFADGIIPGGVMDGNNAVFTLPQAPNPAASLRFYRNGLAQLVGLDYTIQGNAVTFNAGSIPQPGDTLVAWYRY